MSERDAIVAWLRAEADRMEGDMRADPEGEMAVMHGQRMLYYRQAATSIERGDHLPANVAGDDAIVEVTEADREAYLSLNMLPEFDAADVRAGRWDKVAGLQAFARHRATHAGEVERLREEIARLKERGAQAVLAYHVAICSPKGVVPDDSLYDPAIAAKIQAELDRARQALEASR